MFFSHQTGLAWVLRVCNLWVSLVRIVENCSEDCYKAMTLIKIFCQWVKIIQIVNDFLMIYLVNHWFNEVKVLHETLKNAFLNCVIIVQRNVFETSSYILVYNRICTIEFCINKFCDSSDLCKNFSGRWKCFQIPYS